MDQHPHTVNTNNTNNADRILLQQLKKPSAYGKTFIVGPDLSLDKPETIEGYFWARDAIRAAFEQGRRLGRKEVADIAAKVPAIPDTLELISKDELAVLRMHKHRDEVAQTMCLKDGQEVLRFWLEQFAPDANNKLVRWRLFDEKRQEAMGFTYTSAKACWEAAYGLMTTRLEMEAQAEQAQAAVQANNEAAENQVEQGVPPSPSVEAKIATTDQMHAYAKLLSEQLGIPVMVMVSDMDEAGGCRIG